MIKWLIYNNEDQFNALNDRLHLKMKQNHPNVIYVAEQFASVKKHPSDGRIAFKFEVDTDHPVWTAAYNELTTAEKNNLTDLTDDWFNTNT